MRGSVRTQRGKKKDAQTKNIHSHMSTHYMHILYSNTHLSPGVHCFVPPVAEPSPATDTGVPLLVFRIGGREIYSIGPSLGIQRYEEVIQGGKKTGSN